MQISQLLFREVGEFDKADPGQEPEEAAKFGGDREEWVVGAVQDDGAVHIKADLDCLE